jgi:hypothetical protein
MQLSFPPLLFGTFENTQLCNPAFLHPDDGEFEAAVYDPLPPSVISKIATDPSQSSPLAYIQFLHHDFNEGVSTGELIVHSSIARDVAEIMSALFKAQFPIEKARLLEYYPDTDLSMEDNNSSAFSPEHPLGIAIDLNPLVNPYHNIHSRVVVPKMADPHLYRCDNIKGMIKRDDPVVTAFKSKGWLWRGDSRNPVNYKRFEYFGEKV